MHAQYFKKHLTSDQLHVLQEHIDSSILVEDIEIGEKTDHDCALVFFDLCNFTNISFSLNTTAVLEIIQELFQFVAENVTDHGGMIDKYPGDGVVAFFPRNYSEKRHVVVESALDCVAEVMYWFYSEFRYKYDLLKSSHSLDLAIGIDAGLISIAHVGAVHHSELILLGDSVNCASKCQQAAQKREVVVGKDAVERVSATYSKYFSTGPNTGVIYTPSNAKYTSSRFDWEVFANASRWIDKNL